MSSPAAPLNRLASEASLYLQQHARNPVDWFPWGKEAFERALTLDRPIFLSIGYSACHWCHVMEHESFEDPTIARILNEHFVSIKVDREERPDLDSIYMTALQMMTNEGGGWPLSVWLTPEGKPFYAGTYFPPDNRYAPHRPAFRNLLHAIADAWKERRQEIEEQSGAIVHQLRAMSAGNTAIREGTLHESLFDSALSVLPRIFDATHGGFGSAPKFPQALELSLLLRLWKRLREAPLLNMVQISLDKMAMGGIYDALGGGFHRYSTDARWLVPHFEKMLYDNALLASTYVDAWLITGNSDYRDTACETLSYVLREMTSPTGAFYSTQDADSDGVEGKFYLWSKGEIEAILGPDAELLNYVYEVTDAGNFEGRSILHRTKNWELLARMQGIDVLELRRRISEAKQKLYHVRSQRVWPGCDRKFITAWNGLMIQALAHAGSAFAEPTFVGAAVRAAEDILQRLSTPEGRLYRTASSEHEPKLNGYLEDYAALIVAFLDVYEATFDVRWLVHALRFAEVMIEQFEDPTGGFYFTSRDHEALIARTKDVYDGSTPSGNSLAVLGLLRLAAMTGRQDLRDSAVRTLQASIERMRESPMGCSLMLAGLDFYLGPVSEYVVVGHHDDEATQHVWKLLRSQFMPNRVVVFHDPRWGEPAEPLRALLHGRSMQENQVTTYICVQQECRAPLVGVAALQAELEAVGGN